MRIAIRHWLPIITFCPVNSLPDLIYVTVHFDVPEDEHPRELYTVRRQIRTLLRGRKMFMEDIAILVAKEFPDALAVEVRLAFNRHYVVIGV